MILFIILTTCSSRFGAHIGHPAIHQHRCADHWLKIFAFEYEVFFVSLADCEQSLRIKFCRMGRSGYSGCEWQEPEFRGEHNEEYGTFNMGHPGTLALLDFINRRISMDYLTSMHRNWFRLHFICRWNTASSGWSDTTRSPLLCRLMLNCMRWLTLISWLQAIFFAVWILFCLKVITL